MPSVTVRVPDSIRKSGYIDAQLTASVKARLAAILTRVDIWEPSPPIPEVSAHANIWLNAADEQRLRALGAPRNLSVGETITALLVADADQWKRPVMGVPAPPAFTCSQDLSRVLERLKLEPRDEQARFFKGLQKITDLQDQGSSKLSRVLFAEAGTGVGKTLAYLSAIHAFLKKNKTAQVGIAVPSHALMDQLMREWRRIQDALGEPVATVALIGQGEFVSVQALEAIRLNLSMDDAQVADQIQKWMDKGGPCAADGVIRHAWTVAGLRLAAPDFRHIEDVTLVMRDTDEDPGFRSYKNQWATLPNSSLMVCSHAMLASLVRQRIVAQSRALKGDAEVKEATAAWKALTSVNREKRLYEVLNEIYACSDCEDGLDRLPNLDLLVVDEAHTLEDAFNLVLSQNISLWSMKKDLDRLHQSDPRHVTKGAITAMNDLWHRLQRSPQASVDNALILHADDKQCLVEINDILQGVLKVGKKKIADNAAYRRLFQIARSIQMAVIAGDKYEGSIGAMIDWSPDRKWPRLMVGRMSVARELNYLWTAVAQRSILVSGTLYEELPQVSCETARRSLSVPIDQVMTMEPVVAPWQYTPVTVCVAADIRAPDGRVKFLRPTLKNKSTNAEIEAYAMQHAFWMEDVARYLLDAHQSAAGGMLILGTAYADVAAIAQLVGKNTKETILVHEAGVALATLRKKYLDLARDGQRPFLFAVGGAWTGFDLHLDCNPNALTDLVILNAPFGAISRSLARENRVRRPGGIFEIVGLMVVLVRQGIGRLVRSPQTPANRRIHWLDPRIHQLTMAAMFNPVKRLFAKYKQIIVS